jgi:hypothetical protein
LLSTSTLKASTRAAGEPEGAYAQSQLTSNANGASGSPSWTVTTQSGGGDVSLSCYNCANPLATETSHLEHREANLNREIRTDRRADGGNLTNNQKAQVNRQQNRISNNIDKDKHN